MVSIAQWLVAEGLLDAAQAASATERQRLRGGYFGDHVVDAGHLAAAEFYAALARSWRAARRDLVADPPDASLLAEVDVERAVELGWLACELTEDGSVVVASSVAPTEDLVVEVLDQFPGRQPEFVSCTRDDLDSVALALRVERLAGSRRTPPSRLVRPGHVALAFAGALLAVVGAVVLPTDVLAVLLLVAAFAFLIGGVLQVLTGYALLVALDGTPPSGGAAPASDDVDLPLYTVIVRVCGGSEGLNELFDNFRSVDYPRERTDAIIVVAQEDADTLAALRATSPRGWVRVARVPLADFVDVVRACDHALALARGRYVVAYDQDERPAPDQLRRAVEVFEGDLADRLSGGRAAPPLVGLRVARRTGSQPFGLDRMTAADEALGFGGPAGRGPARSADVTAVHFNMRLLRRLGGFGLLLPRGRARTDAGPRIEVLDSSSQRASQPHARQWWDQQADAFSQDVLDVASRTLALLRRGANRPPAETTALAARIGAILLLLSYPVVVGGGAAAAVRGSGKPGSLAGNAAWVALGELALVVGAVTAVAAAFLARRRGWRAGADALALPVLWLLYAFATWAAVYAVLVRPRSSAQAADEPWTGPSDGTPV
ncbi:MAG TPA: hypothetical protein VM575_16630 [Nocardioides sp.]|nr:hypothetical protein [Nocardioides sp.]